VAAYDRGDYATAIQALTHLSLPVTGTRGWNFAEVTAGGIPLQEINPTSMASRLRAGLYLIGEMLDCDGRIGGFNFQWAWSTGYIAGTHAAESLP
jgi:predicted flavoprotein YhiN